MIYGTLKSKINLDGNKNFYENKKLKKKETMDEKNLKLEEIDEKHSDEDVRRTEMLFKEATRKMDQQ